MTIEVDAFRAVCTRCLRPESACWCRDLPGIATRTQLVFLQHPRERYVAIGTARMAHLALPGSMFFRGVDFDDNPALEAIARDPRAAILFPSPGAADLRQVEAPSTLVVVDGTWSQARKLVQRSAVLQRLPKVGFVPAKPGNYRIRKEPAAHCLSTIEAVVEALGIMEGEPERFAPMLRTFEGMVDLQLARKATRESPPRYRRPRQRVPKPPPIPPELVSRFEDLVLLYAEGHAPAGPFSHPPPAAQLEHVVALRPHSGERFEAVLAPDRPLAESTPHHLGLSAERILGGESLELARRRWAAFLRPGDLIASWGHFSLNLAREAQLELRPIVDLRHPTLRVLARKPGGIDAAARLLGKEMPGAPLGEGRAGLRLEALARILEALRERLAVSAACG